MPFKNTEDRKAHGRKYYQTHKARINARTKLWVAANPDKHRASCNNWKKAHPERVLELARMDASNYRARKRNAFIESIDHTLVFERDGGTCQICYEPIGTSKWHIDHIHPLVAGGEHSYANVQLSHASCNQRKWARVP